jgi:hypothetical protein
VRALLKHRNFSVAALLTLALGIGINTSIFTLLYSIAFRPLPVKNPDRKATHYGEQHTFREQDPLIALRNE